MGTALVALGNKIWNWIMELVIDNLSSTPAAFSGEAWYAAGVAHLYIVLPIALSLMNIFLLINFLQQSANLRQQLTLETFVEILIRFVFANCLVIFSWDIVSGIFNLGSYLVYPADTLYLDDSFINNLSLGNEILGVIYFLVAVIGAFIILITVWGRFLQLYLLAATAPAAFASVAGSGSISQTASAFIRTLIGKVVEVLIISLAIAIGTALARGFSLGLDSVVAATDANTFNDIIQNLIGMDSVVTTIKQMGMIVVTAASVKGADAFLRRAFHFG